MADYYKETFKLHWDPEVARQGLGTLLKKVNHVAIIVSDVNRSLTFYVQILGLQQIRRPNFDRYGAWLTMGNCELHLIKGIPVVPLGDNLIVPHISIESDDVDAVLKKLKELNVPFSKNVSVPDATESKPITQYFIRDPDGYYIELCNCDILTNFCMRKDCKRQIKYEENVKHVEISHIFKLAFWAQTALDTGDLDLDLDTLVPDRGKWAENVDPVKMSNMLSRCNIYGDIMQGETEESISSALKQADNHVPLATKIIRARKKDKQVFYPPAFYVQGEEKYQPVAYVAPKMRKASRKMSTFGSAMDISFEKVVRHMFNHFDTKNSGLLTKDEVLALLRSLRQNPSDEEFAEQWTKHDVNNRGAVDVEVQYNFCQKIPRKEVEFLTIIKDHPTGDEENWLAFFNMLDADGNRKVTCPELMDVTEKLNLPLSDVHIENMFTEADEDGNGFLTLDELKQYFMSH